FDQLVRFVVLDTLQFYGTPVLIQPDLYLWKIEVQSAVLESLASQQCGKLPGNMEPFLQLIARRCPQNRVSLFVGQPMCTSDHAASKTRALRGSVFVEINKY